MPNQTSDLNALFSFPHVSMDWHVGLGLVLDIVPLYGVMGFLLRLSNTWCTIHKMICTALVLGCICVQNRTLSPPRQQGVPLRTGMEAT